MFELENIRYQYCRLDVEIGYLYFIWKMSFLYRIRREKIRLTEPILIENFNY